MNSSPMTGEDLYRNEECSNSCGVIGVLSAACSVIEVFKYISVCISVSV